MNAQILILLCDEFWQKCIHSCHYQQLSRSRMFHHSSWFFMLHPNHLRCTDNFCCDSSVWQMHVSSSETSKLDTHIPCVLS